MKTNSMGPAGCRECKVGSLYGQIKKTEYNLLQPHIKISKLMASFFIRRLWWCFVFKGCLGTNALRIQWVFMNLVVFHNHYNHDDYPDVKNRSWKSGDSRCLLESGSSQQYDKFKSEDKRLILVNFGEWFRQLGCWLSWQWCGGWLTCPSKVDIPPPGLRQSKPPDHQTWGWGWWSGWWWWWGEE